MIPFCSFALGFSSLARPPSACPTEGSFAPMAAFGYIDPANTAIVDGPFPSAALEPFFPSDGTFLEDANTSAYVLHFVPGLQDDPGRDYFNGENWPGHAGGCINAGGSFLGYPHCGFYKKVTYEPGCPFFTDKPDDAVVIGSLGNAAVFDSEDLFMGCAAIKKEVVCVRTPGGDDSGPTDCSTCA